jgi:hypothetical protein
VIYTINHAPVRSVVVARGAAAERAHDENGLPGWALHCTIPHCDPLPAPPVFASCTQAASAVDQGAATSFYWSVIPQDKPLEPMPRPIVLEQAVRHKPWWARRRWCRPTSI